jgi:predicted glutamine amidotransferase
MFMSDLLTRAEQSLIQQSFKARERKEPLNGDGFGVGWYVPEIDPTPCVFTSTQPAWSNRNLYRLADKVRSSLFFAHVRAATGGLSVGEHNCHPFQHNRFLWMHNGAVREFQRIKRRLRESLDDAVYDVIQGTTDSEHAFALFLNRLLDRIDDYTVDDLVDALKSTILKLNGWTEECKVSAPCHYNFALTDGQTIIATRYTNDPDVLPPTLYYSVGERFENVDGHYRMRSTDRQPQAVIIASEPISETRSDWIEVPPNNMVLVTPELHVRVLRIS